MGKESPESEIFRRANAMKVINNNIDLNHHKNLELFYPQEHRNNELSIYHYGKHICAPSGFWGPDVRDYFLLHFVVSGKGIYRVNGKEYSLGAGQGFVIKPGETTFYKADETDPWEYYFVAFHGSRAKTLVDSVRWTDGYICKPRDFDALKKRLRELYAVKMPNEGGGYKIIGLLYLIFSELISDAADEGQASDEKQRALDTALDYIKANYASPIRVTDVADHVCMHRSNLYKLFKEVLGISVIDYLHSTRLNAAASLLLMTDLSVLEIAAKVGYTDTPHFCKAFKKRYLFTPLGYRKCYKKG